MYTLAPVTRHHDVFWFINILVNPLNTSGPGTGHHGPVPGLKKGTLLWRFACQEGRLGHQNPGLTRQAPYIPWNDQN